MKRRKTTEARGPAQMGATPVEGNGSRWDGLLLRFPEPVPFEPAWALQRALWEARRSLRLPDCLLMLEHEPVYTLGRHGDERFVRTTRPAAIPVVPIDRGGEVTYHGPGQLTAYFICDLRAHDLGAKPFVHALEETVIRLLDGYGVSVGRRDGMIGVWTDGNGSREKLAATGIRITRGVSLHGIALNVLRSALAGFGGIVPCGLAGERVTAVEALLQTLRDEGDGADDPSAGTASPGQPAARDLVAEPAARDLVAELAAKWAGTFAEVFGLGLRPVDLPAPRDAAGVEACLRLIERQARRGARKPGWLKMGLPKGRTFLEVRRTLEDGRLYTVCEGAHCPNRQECWSAGTATFMILGRTCTRRCRFCAVAKGAVEPVESDEPARLAAAAARMGLRHVVVTSVTRDDLPDGGAAHFAETIAALRRRIPGVSVEVLIPDFRGDPDALGTVVAARPDVLNHNIETVPRLYALARPQADYRRSLDLLATSARAGLRTKSGFMVGLGESPREIRLLLRDLREAGCGRVTIGQYLQPNRESLPVKRYWTPAEFAVWHAEAGRMGFEHVESGPLVRSSYHAAEALRSEVMK